jgi:hypothetical protein
MKEPLSLFKIETELDELLDLREQVTEELHEYQTKFALPNESLEQSLAAIDTQIDSYLKREARKVNGIASTIQSFDSAAALLKAEADRLYTRSQAFSNRAQRIKQRCCEVMRQTLGDRAKLETPEHTLRVQRNGGLAPLVINSEGNLPQSLRKVTVTMSLADWEVLKNTTKMQWDFTPLVSQPEPNISAIRESLEKNSSFLGCYLGERGFHLRVS